MDETLSFRAIGGRLQGLFDADCGVPHECVPDLAEIQQIRDIRVFVDHREDFACP